MSSDQKNFQQLIFQELLLYFNPLIETGGDPDKIALLLDAIGWDTDAMSGASSLLNDVGAIVSSINVVQDIINNPPESLSDITDKLAEISAIVSGIKNISLPSISGVEKLPVDILKKLLTVYISEKSDLVYSILIALKVFEDTGTEITDSSGNVIYTPGNFPDFNPSKLFDYLSDPAGTFQTDYLDNGFTDLDATNATAQKIFAPLQYILYSLGIDAKYGMTSNVTSLSAEENKRLQGLMTSFFRYINADAGTTVEVGATLGLLPETEGGPGAYLVPFGTITFTHDVGNWTITATVDAEVEGFQVTNNGFQIYDDSVNTFGFDLLLEKNSGDSSDFLIGSTTGTRLEIGDVSFNAGITLTGSRIEYFIKSIFKNGSIVLSPGDGDGFIQKILSGVEANADFDLTIGWDNVNGFHIEGSGGLEINIPVHIDVGPLSVDGAVISINPDAGSSSIPIELGIDATLSIGPFTGTVQEIGLEMDVSFPPDGGNLGPVNLDFAFKPPTGLGLSIDAQGFKGGGFLFLDPDKGEYSGGLELEFQDTIALKAIGILNTIMPDGSNGFSLIIIITAEFSPIQLGYGFTLNGVGGLIGINRTCEVEVLQSGVKDGTLNSILFPTDIVANAAQIISDMQSVFPIYEGQYVFGPMAEIGWGTPTLIEIQLGLLIEIPDPFRIYILGVLKAVLPDEDLAILNLQVNFLGVIDFDQGSISFDASLYNSYLLTFSLTGDMALRINWGDNPVFVLTVGGFHPSYNPPANLGLGTLARIGINLFPGNNPKLRIETYFAVTSNTVQFGANGQLHVSVSKFDVDGYIGFDVLFQFSPFYFIAQISASLSVSCSGEDLLSISLLLSLDGPTPWHAKGEASFKVLVVKVKVSISETFGDTNSATLPPVEVMPLLTDALSQTGNWRADLPAGSNLQVTLRSIDTSDNIIVHPFGILNISQKVVPLDITISKFGSQSVSGENKFSITDVSLGTNSVSYDDEKEEFAPAQFIQMSDSQKLSSNDFEKYNSGASVSGSGSAKTDYAAQMEVEYELKYLKKNKAAVLLKLTLGLFAQLLKNTAVGKSKLSSAVKAPSVMGTPKVSIDPEKFVIANTSDLKLFGDELVFNTQLEAKLKMAEIVSASPSAAKDIQVLPSYEAVQ